MPVVSATPTGAVNAIRTARAWPAFAPSRRSTFWINALLTIVAVAASYGAAIGQAGFAELYLGMQGPERFVVFLIIEATAVALMLLANQTALAGDSAAGLWALVWAVTGGAVTMQVVHAQAIGHPEAAMVYATASVLTVVLWRAKTRRSLRDRLRAAGMIEDPLPRYRPIRWLLRPRETFRAWYLALGEGVSDPATAMDMARADRLYHRAAVAADREDARARRAKLPVPDLTDQQHVVPPWRVTHPHARRFGVLPWHHHTPATIEAALRAREAEALQSEPAVHATERIEATRVDAARIEAVEPARIDARSPRHERPEIARHERTQTAIPSAPVPSPRYSADPIDDATPIDAMTMIEAPVSSPPSLLGPVRAQLDGHFPAPTSGDVSLKARVYEVLDSNVDADDPRRPAEIAAIIADQFESTDTSTISRYVRMWRSDVQEGRRDPSRTRRRTVAGRTRP